MRPRLAKKARLRWDRLSERHLLVYPERGLSLNQTAARILELCTGDRTVAEIVDELGRAFPEHELAGLRCDVESFLEMMRLRGLVEVS